MRINFNNTDEEENNDLFETQDPAEEEVREKKQRLSRDNPEYWEQEESRWEHLRVSLSTKMKVMATVVAVAAALLTIGIVEVFSPCVDEACQYGYIDTVERHGSFFKTYECTMLPYRSVMDTTNAYHGDFKFSADKETGKKLKHFRRSGIPVRVGYKVYGMVMPWRGESKTIAVSIDSVCPDSIIPPFKPAQSPN